MDHLSDKHVTIVGLGLMGGSLALALRPHVGHLTAVDKDPLTLEVVLNQGIADEVANNVQLGIKHADLLILAVPVRSIVYIIGEINRWRTSGLMVMDLGSTKMDIIAAMDQLPEKIQAIGGHPLCGREAHGFKSTQADMYRDQTFVLCRSLRSTALVENVALEVLTTIGARPWFLSAERHDSLVAMSSHMPYVASAALVRLAGTKAAEDAQLWRAAASGFRDTSRLAGTETQLMLDILLTNKVEILKVLKMYQQQLGTLDNLLQNGKESALADWLNEAQYHYMLYRDRSGKV